MNIPHLLSYFRLAAAPVAAGAALAGYREAFFLLILASLFTDLVDGPIARWLRQESQYGAKLDTIADACTMLAGMFGIYILESQDMRPDYPWFYLFLVSYAAAALAGLAKFGTLPAYHLYTSKLAAFSASVFFLWLYLFGYSQPFFLAIVGLGLLANVESLIATARLRHLKTDIGSAFFKTAGTDAGAGRD